MLTKEKILKAKQCILLEDKAVYIITEQKGNVYSFAKKDLSWQKHKGRVYLGIEYQIISAEEAWTIINAWQKEVYDNNQRLNNAINFAVKYHTGQLRKGTTVPYIVHPLESMQILQRMNGDTDLLIAGVLHDILEDTQATEEEIAQIFGSEVAHLVAAHSEDKSKTWEERKTIARGIEKRR